MGQNQKPVLARRPGVAKAMPGRRKGAKKVKGMIWARYRALRPFQNQLVLSILGSTRRSRKKLWSSWRLGARPGFCFDFLSVLSGLCESQRFCPCPSRSENNLRHLCNLRIKRFCPRPTRSENNHVYPVNPVRKGFQILTLPCAQRKTV